MMLGGGQFCPNIWHGLQAIMIVQPTIRVTGLLDLKAPSLELAVGKQISRIDSSTSSAMHSCRLSLCLKQRQSHEAKAFRVLANVSLNHKGKVVLDYTRPFLCGEAVGAKNRHVFWWL